MVAAGADASPGGCSLADGAGVAGCSPECSSSEWICHNTRTGLACVVVAVWNILLQEHYVMCPTNKYTKISYLNRKTLKFLVIN